jgi:hypothetical protein
MALKYKLDQAAFEKLEEGQQALYKKSGEMYVLDVDGVDNNSDDLMALKAQNEKLLSEKKDAAKKAKEAEDAATKAAEEAARKAGDTEALEKSWQEKLAKREAELTSQIETLNGSVNGMLVDNVATKLANELAVPGSADILIPHIKSRLAAEQRDGQFVTVIRDAQGKPSAATLEDLKNEFSGNAAFAPVIAGSKATGGGANGGGQGGGAAKTVKRDQFDQMSQVERSAFAKDGGKVID